MLQLSMADNENLQTLHTTTLQYKRRRIYLTTTNVNSSSSTPLAVLHFSQNYSATFTFSALPKGLKAESGLCPDFQPFPWKPQPKKALFCAERLNRARCDRGLSNLVCKWMKREAFLCLSNTSSVFPLSSLWGFLSAARDRNGASRECGVEQDDILYPCVPKSI